MPDFFAYVLAPGNWPTFVFVLTRLTGLMLVAPFWSMSMLTRPARAAITVLLAILLLPGAPKVALPAQVLDLPVPLAMELVIGLVIGLAAAVIVQGVGLAGEVVSLQMGLSLGPALSPMADMSVSGVGQLQSLLAVLIYMAVGGHLVLLKGLADSLKSLPPGASLSLESGTHATTLLVGSLYVTAIRTAAPVMVALLLTNVALALLNRAVPQLNAMMVALPLTIGVGLIMIGASMPIVGSVIAGWTEGIGADVARLLASFRAIPAGP